MNLIEKANRATITEAAEIIGCKRPTLCTAINMGHIPVVHQDSDAPYTRYVDLEDVEVYFQRPQAHRRAEVMKLIGDGHSVAQVAHKMGIKPASVRRAIRRQGRRP
jgi:DNA-binding NarL/FixJ family response regulator